MRLWFSHPAFGRSPVSALPCRLEPDSCWRRRRTARAGSERTQVAFLNCHIICTSLLRLSPLLPKYKTNFSQCLVHFFDELRYHFVKNLHVFFIPFDHDIMQAFTLHTRVIVGKVLGIFSRHPHAVLHLGHVSRLYGLETTEPEFHEIPGGKRAFQFKAVAVTA